VLFQNSVLMFAQSAIEIGGSRGFWLAELNFTFPCADKGPCKVFDGSCSTWHGNR